MKLSSTPRQNSVFRSLLRLPSFGSKVAQMTALFQLLVSGCSPDFAKMKPVGDASSVGADGSNVHQPACDMPPLVEEYVNLTMDPNLLATQCVKACHSEGGIGQNVWRGAMPGDSTATLQTNFNRAVEVASKVATTGNPWMVEYPQGHVDRDLGGGATMSHGGGEQVLTQDQIDAITAFHNHIGEVPATGSPSFTVPDCNVNGPVLTEDEYFKDVHMLNYDEVLVKACRDIFGTAIPDAPLGLKSKEDLVAQLNFLIKAQAEGAGYGTGYYDRARDIMDELFHTRFYSGGNEAIGLMGDQYGVPWSQYKNAEVAESVGNTYAALLRDHMSIQSLLNGRFFSVPGEEDPSKTWVQRVRLFTPAPGFEEPNSGIGTDTLLLNKLATTDTNKNRGRARVFMLVFGMVDILKRGSANVSAPADKAFPTLTYAPCAICHEILDRVAGAFWAYQKGKYNPNLPLPPEFLSIGWKDGAVDLKDPEKLNHFFDLLVQDPAFAKAMGKLAYASMLFRNPIEQPDKLDPNYGPKMDHFTVEDAFLDYLGKLLMENGYDMNVINVEVMASKWFAAAGRLDRTVSADRQESLRGIGPRMADPRVRAMRFRQVFGDAVMKDNDIHEMIETYRLELGGFDSKTVLKPAVVPSAVSVLVANKLAYKSYEHVKAEFGMPANQRVLLNDLDFGDGMPPQPPYYPSTKNPVSQKNVEMYKKALAKISRVALGKHVDPNGPEVAIELDKWFDIWNVCLADQAKDKDSNCVEEAWGAYLASMFNRVEFLVL